MTALLKDIDPGGLLEYSVVFSERSLNHMSQKFQTVMCDISIELKEVYQAESIALVPGGGTYAMEAVARQFGIGKHALVIRNGWFSYRWSQIFERGDFAKKVSVIKARPENTSTLSPFIPPPLKEVLEKIHETRPEIVFMPHVETSSGLILPNEYIKQISKAAHESNALVVLDCIASGCTWTNMKDLGVDILISAPQKGWSSSPSCGVVMMSEKALNALEESTSNSFAIDLKKWHSIMKAYESGGHAYHATMPTDSLCHFRNTILEAKKYGFDRLCENQWKLGHSVRSLLKTKGVLSVAGEGFESPGVVVCYTQNEKIQNGSDFKNLGVQIAGGVPLMCDEPKDFKSFRIGLFGLDKLYNVEQSIEKLNQAINKIF